MAAAKKPTKPKQPPGSKAAAGLAQQKLESSGLTLKDAEELGIQVLDGTQTHACHRSFEALPSLRLNYYDEHGKPLQVKPKWPAFYRLRYLDTKNDFNKLTEHKEKRYAQEPESGVAAYLPKLVDWAELFKNEEPLFITEGELKAAKACKEGFPTIGLGGVYNFRSPKLGLLFLPELERIRWVKRRVYVVYDSDFRTNELVCAALRALAEELEARGALTYMVCLPDVEGLKKTGLDDFLVSEGREAFIEVLQEAQQLTLCQVLWKLNDELCYVRDPGLIINTKTQQKLSPASFKEHAYSTADFAERQVKPDGTVSLKRVSAAGAWLKWPQRLEARKLSYLPGQEKFVRVNGSGVDFNIWSGWGVEPKRGDVQPFLQLVDHIFTGAEPEAKQWFLRWCAYPLQYPGTKLFTSAVIHGIKHGTGKSLIGYTLGRIYGQNFEEIKQTDLHANFNEWAEAKQFVLGDDVTGSNKRQDADILKKLITQKSIRINTKYVASYTVTDCINYLFTSNQPDAFFLEDDDRRFFIHEVVVQPMAEEVYVEYDLWLETGGAAAVFDYLLKLDLGDFNPAAHAFKTVARERMILDVKSDLGGWVHQLVAMPDALLRIGDMPLTADLYTNKQLLAVYDPTGKTGTTANGLGRELRRAGVPQACGGQPVRTEHGQDRYYILRNVDKWHRATATQVQKYLAEQQALMKKRVVKEEKY